MNKLYKLQQEFSKAIFSAPSVFLTKKIHRVHRFSIYRNNIFNKHAETLKRIYPNILKLVGEEFFDFTAHTYIRAYYSGANLSKNFGENLHEFLAEFSPAQSLIYLPDIAHLEWLCHQVCQAADHDALDIACLQLIAADDYPQLKFHLHPAIRLFSSDFSLLQIWELCQNNVAKNVDLSVGGVNLLIQRYDSDVVLKQLSAAEFALLNAFAQLKDFEEACLSAVSIEENFDIAATLQRLILEKVVVRFNY